jgi:PKD repeat protein
MNARLVLSAFAAVVVAAVAPGGVAVTGADTITTVAGNGTSGFSGDGGQATSAQLGAVGIAVDAAGNVYVADQGNHRVRKVTADGVITTVAGTGERGFSGDDGQATSARLNDPNGVAVDAAGNIYIADMGNMRVRRVSAAGVITTVAGTGFIGSSGDGGPATSATLAFPSGVAVDAAGNVYIADQLNDRVRKVTATGVIATIAGTGDAGFAGDGGQATSAQLRNPFGVAVDVVGNVYIADRDNHRVRRVDAAGVITSVAGTETFGFSGDGGPATSAQLKFPAGVAVDAIGSIYIADSNNHRVRRVSTGGVITTVAGTGTAAFSGDGGQAISAQLDFPLGVAVDAIGNLYVADTGNRRVRKVTNPPPSAVFTASPVGGQAPLAVSFDGSGSSDPNGSIVAFAWDFGDGTPAGSGATVQHTYQSAGSFTARLTVTDDSGGTASAEQTITATGTPGPPPPPPAPRARARCGGLPATIVGTNRRNVITGTPRRDIIHGRGGNDLIRGLGGNDLICGGPGRDTLQGGRGRDRLIGGPGRDRAHGGPGRDTCTAERRQSC